MQKAANVTVEHNELSFFAYAGISVGWSWNFADPSYTDNITVAYNHVHDLGTGLYRQVRVQSPSVQHRLIVLTCSSETLWLRSTR